MPVSEGPGQRVQYTDEELVRRCLDGDESAWEVLVRRYQRLVYSIPARYGLGADIAADIFGSVWLKLIEAMPKLRDQTKLASWLITTTTRECWSTSRRLRREPAIGEGGDDDGMQRAEATGSPLALAELERLEQQQLLRESLEAVGGRCRELLQLLYFADEPTPYAEISRRLEMPVPSIGPTRSRCLEKLRKLMEGKN
jgi:RNA polymerase sigma factor (sigma-70 family)